MNLLPVIILYVEVLLLAFAERKLWNTWFTPLNCLSVPYALVLAICLCINGKLGFVPFYYPSVWVWIIGLAVFFGASCILGLLQRRRTGKSLEPTTAKKFTISPFTFRILEYITWGIFALFIFWFFRLTFVKDLLPGGENFALEWAGHGFFGHLFTVLMGLNIFWLFAADKKHKRYWLYVLGFFGVALLYLVKGWFLTPMAAGLLLRLIVGKTRFGIKVILMSVFTGFAFFFASYWMTLYVAAAEKGIDKQSKKKIEYKTKLFSFIGTHAVTYLTAGVYGLSEDLAQNRLESQDAEVIYAPFVNIYKVFGDKNYVYNINNQFVQITTNDSSSNVRSFFGSLYVYLGTWHSIAYAFVFSGLLYLLFAFARKRRNTFALIIVGWIMGCLSMGWFDPYSTSLNFISIPCFLMAIFGLCYAWENRKKILGFKMQPYKRKTRRILALLQTVSLALSVSFFWAPWHLPSYFLGVSAGIALVFVLTVPRRGIDFRFLKPYLAFLLLYLLFWVSVIYSSSPSFAVSRCFGQIAILLVPFVFWGMTPRFFTPRRLRFFVCCLVIGCIFLFVAKVAQLVYCFNIFWPFFNVWYIDTGATYMNIDSALLYVLNEFLSNQSIYLSWAYLDPIMHTTVEAMVFNLAFAFVFIARIQKHPWLNSRLKRCAADFALLIFAFALITANSKTGQFLFIVNLLLLLIFCFRQKRWKTACILSSFFLLFSIVGLYFFGMGILGRFSQSVHVGKDLRNHEEKITSDGSLLPRIYCWSTAVEMIKEKPVFGFGFGFKKDFLAAFTSRYPDYRHAYQQPHNQFLAVLVSNGILGLCLFLLLVFQAINLVWRSHRLWAWIWFFSWFVFCFIDIIFNYDVILFVCLPYCFLMVEYYNRRDIRKFATDSID